MTASILQATGKPPQRVLVFGGTGPILGQAIPAIARTGSTVRAFVRNPDGRDAVLGLGAHEIALGDLRDPASIARALEGIDAVFYAAPVAMADQAEIGRQLVGQASRAGVSRFIFSSVIHPVLSLPNHAAKLPVEDALIGSGMRFTILHPAVLFQNIGNAWPKIVQTGVFAEPWSTTSRLARVDFRDVAEVAAIALTRHDLDYGTFELCGNDPCDRLGITAMLSDILQRDIRAERLDPGVMNEGLRPMAEHYDAHGLPGNGLILQTILGRPPRRLRDYLAELAAI